jgi:hypothetical protein
MGGLSYPQGLRVSQWEAYPHGDAEMMNFLVLKGLEVCGCFQS